jgi:hypothetical protein
LRNAWDQTGCKCKHFFPEATKTGEIKPLPVSFLTRQFFRKFPFFRESYVELSAAAAAAGYLFAPGRREKAAFSGAAPAAAR